MIFVTGDCHMEYQKFNMANFPEQKISQERII